MKNIEIIEVECENGGMIGDIVPIMGRMIGNAEINSVNSRDLHGWLESGRQYADWIKDRLGQLGAVENVDYIPFSQKNENGNNKPLKTYIVSVDTAKHLAMMERNERGKEAREYFIESEKRLRESEKLDASALIPIMESMAKQIGQLSKTIGAISCVVSALQKDTKAIQPRWKIQHRKAERLSEGEFIDSAKRVIKKYPGINQSAMLAKMGIRRDDKRSLALLRKFEDVFWEIDDDDGRAYVYGYYVK